MKKDVIVIGGGIIGMSCAVELATRGAQVTVIEKGKVGMGCSYGNAGWMTPCFAMPLPMPGMLMKSMKWMLDPEGPLYIKPSLNWKLAQWLLLFLKNMNQQQCHQAIEGLVELSKLSLNKYEALAQEYPQIDFHKKGLLMASQTPDGLQAAIDELNLVSQFAVPGRAMNADEIKQFEPALQGPILGGVYFPNEAHAEPLAVVTSLQEKALKLGVRILENTEVLQFQIENNKLQRLKIHSHTQNTDLTDHMAAEKYVMATGSWSADLAKQLRLNVPILGGKGYAMIVPPLTSQPTYPLMLVEKKIAITPRANSLRIAGTLELVDQDFSITERRVRAIEKGARQFLKLPPHLDIQETWNGLRPCTPDGVPLIGPTKKADNLVLACGHQMLGLQSGYGTGVLVSDLVMTGSSQWNRKIFNPDRF